MRTTPVILGSVPAMLAIARSVSLSMACAEASSRSPVWVRL